MAAKNDATTPEVTAPAPAIDIDAIKAELKAQLMAEIKTEIQTPEPAEAAPDPSMEEYVQVTLFKDGRTYVDDVFVGVNGERVQIKRGVPVKIKRKFALILEQQQRQDLLTAELISRQSAEYAAMRDKLDT